MSNDIKHIVVYNPAPLAIKDVSGLYADQEELKKLIEKYDGHIVRFVSDEDELDAGVRNHLYETAGEKIITKNRRPCNQWYFNEQNTGYNLS